MRKGGRWARPWVALALAAAALSCAPRVAHRRPLPQEGAAWDGPVVERLESLGQNGDWLVIRGYKDVDDTVAQVTSSPVSHAGILDRGRLEVIEAEGQGIHLSALPAFVAKAQRVLLVRPEWAGGGGGDEAVAEARSLLGKPFDYLGTVGLNDPGKYYCSELAVRAYRRRIPEGTAIPAVIAPGYLYTWGRILYDSGARRP